MYGAHSQSWKNALSALRTWVELHGEVSNIPAGTEVAGVALSHWVHARRFEHRRGRLDPEQVTQLQELPGWSWGASQQQRWESAYKALCTFSAQHGTAAVPAGHVLDDIHLGRWVSQQRIARRRGDLSQDHVVRLEKLPGWSWGTSQQQQWESAFDVLRTVATQDGTADVPGDFALDGLQLGRWVGQQRAAHRRGELSTQRVGALEALPGWFWTARRGAAARGLPTPPVPSPPSGRSGDHAAGSEVPS